MDNFQFVKVGTIGCGLTNQLGFIISGIIYAKMTHKQFIVLDNFNCNFNTVSPRPISQIIDLEHLNEFLEKFDIYVVDKNKVSIEIVSVKYGSLGTVIDITDEVKKRFMPSGKLFIRRGTSLNDIKGDPASGIVKHLFIKYRVNGKLATALYKENLSEDIDFDISKLRPNIEFAWIAPYDIEFYDSILKHIQFQPEFIKTSKETLAVLELTPKNSFTTPELLNLPKVNVIHLRDDEDAINFWGSINKMPIFEFKDTLTRKYIALINKYFDKKDSVIVLTSNLQSGVLKYLHDNGYSVSVSDKSYPNERELNGIVDLLISQACNNVFIGNINPENFHGSTFSYLILKQLSSNVTKVLIDLDEIKRDEFIVSN